MSQKDKILKIIDKTPKIELSNQFKVDKIGFTSELNEFQRMFIHHRSNY